MIGRETIEFSGEVWTWTVGNEGRPVTWYLVTAVGEPAAEIRVATLGLTGGFGSVRVRATVGRTSWTTSIFPDGKTDGWMLPLKAEIRKRENIIQGDQLTVYLDF